MEVQAVSQHNRPKPDTAPPAELSRQMLRWSRLWCGPASSDERHAVRTRLSAWLERCFGHRAGHLLTRREGELSLASSTPFFAAFLGRRATRELSRSVLRDL